MFKCCHHIGIRKYTSTCHLAFIFLVLGRSSTMFSRTDAFKLEETANLRASLHCAIRKSWRIFTSGQTCKFSFSFILGNKLWIWCSTSVDQISFTTNIDRDLLIHHHCRWSFIKYFNNVQGQDFNCFRSSVHTGDFLKRYFVERGRIFVNDDG